MEAEVVFGKEISIEDKTEWEALLPSVGQVLEVHMNSTSLDVLHDSWAGFFIDKVELQETGSVTLHVRIIEAEDRTVSDALNRFTDTGRLVLHLCRSRPCAEVGPEQDGKLHVTAVRLFRFPDYIDSADYVTAGQKLARGWYRYLVKKQPDDTARPRADKSKLATTRRGRVNKRPAAVMHPPRDPSVEKDNTPPAVSTEMRERLRKKLQTIKDRVVPKPSHGGEVVPSSAEEDSSSGSDDEDTEHAPECPDLTGGMTLAPQPPDLSTLGLTGEDRLVKVSKPSKKKKSVRPKELVTKGISSSSLRGQLVQRAVLATQAKRTQQKLRKKKKKKSSAKEKLSEALAKILTKSSKKKKKKKKRKRRINAEGIIESYSGSSSSSSESAVDEEDSSEQDLETPMRKRSRDHPGSVLRLLTDHVRDQLQQSATTELEDTENSITSGVKVMTYFMLQLRPHFQGHQREMRELHHLSACIGALRRGDVATTGDALAGRFIALHQSMIDQNWQTAKHMEIFPMEESSAASTAMVLATRKHSKLVMKAQGYQPTWNPRGKGRGKGEWSSWNDTKGDPKGEKGKGKKGKGKGKSKQTWGDPGQGGEWREKKERPEEKQS